MSSVATYRRRRFFITPDGLFLNIGILGWLVAIGFMLTGHPFRAVWNLLAAAVALLIAIALRLPSRLERGQ